MATLPERCGALLPLAELGERICILGPSNSGKSTMAEAIARKLGCEAVPLDRLYHLPGTDWVARPYAEFQRLHDEAILAQRWVMDGNYSALFTGRLLRATGVILLDVSTSTSLLRYVRRSWFGHERAGGLEGGQDSVKLDMLRHIAVQTRANWRRYAVMYAGWTLPKVRLGSVREIALAYRHWELEGPGGTRLR